MIEEHNTADVAFKEYEEEFIALIEMIYGEGLLSQGGVQSIEEMFSGINLKGLKLLDLGCGLGMYDIYLAKHHPVDIVGVDPQESLINKSEANLIKHGEGVIGSVSFSSMQNPYNLNEFSDDSFDIVFSKESILHVPYAFKQEYFNEIYRVLKPGGRLIILDWLHTTPLYTPSTKKMMEMDGIVFQLLTLEQYQNILIESGFIHTTFQDTTAQHEEFSRQNIDLILDLEDKIKSSFGEDAYYYSLESWNYQKEAFQNRELLTGIFRAVKNN